MNRDRETEPNVAVPADPGAAHVFLDTNTLLHFKRPDQIDWIALTKSVSVVLLVTPVLVRELEYQKVHNRSRKLRDRAQSILLWLGQFAEIQIGTEIRSAVQINIVRSSPLINYAAHHLSVSVSDDELIASAIEYKEARHARVLVVTGDLGLRMKLPVHKIGCIAPLESDRLDDEPDESEKEMAELRRDLMRYQNRVPKLSLTFKEGENFSSIKMLVPSEGPAIRKTYYGLSIGEPSDEAYVEYYSEFAKWKGEVVQYFPCDLVLGNNGSAEAKNVHVDFILPDFISSCAPGDLPDKPKPPRSFLDPLDFGDIATFRNLNNPRPVGKPYFNRSDNSVSWIIPSLVHNRVLTLHTFYLRFYNPPVRSFSFEFLITSADIIDTVKGSLNFIAY